jgi:hypothetical protein
VAAPGFALLHDASDALTENVLAFHRVAEPPVQRALVSEHQTFPETLAALAQLPREMRDEQPP